MTNSHEQFVKYLSDIQLEYNKALFEFIMYSGKAHDEFVTTPQMAKYILLQLDEKISSYEKEHGEIHLPTSSQKKDNDNKSNSDKDTKQKLKEKVDALQKKIEENI